MVKVIKFKAKQKKGRLEFTPICPYKLALALAFYPFSTLNSPTPTLILKL